MTRTTWPVLALLGCSLACGGMEPPKTRATLETTATAYVATPLSNDIFDYAVTVIATIRNPSEDNIRISQCTLSDPLPPLWVEPRSGGQAAWDPIQACTIIGTPYRDIRPGQEVVDTITLRAPWFRSPTGVPEGDIEGTFFLVIETHVCARTNSYGACYPNDVRELVASNHFSITK